MPRLAIIDGDHTVHRYFHAFGPDGPDASIGFAFGRYRRTLGATHAVLVFDNGQPTWRHDLFAGYKADRPEYPPEFHALMVATRKIAEATGIPWVEAPLGAEGDDLVASYCEAAVARGWQVAIVSGDKDLAQLVRDVPEVRMHDEIRKVVWDGAEVERKFGVRPDQLAGYLALVGDTSDGFKGVPGIGPKRAAVLLREYESFRCLMERRNLVVHKATYKALREHADAAMTCYRLASLMRDVPLPVSLEAMRLGMRRPAERWEANA